MVDPPVVRPRLGRTVANDPVPGPAGEPLPGVHWRDVPWAEVERRFAGCPVRPLDRVRPGTLVVSSLDVHRAFLIRGSHRAWMMRKLSVRTMHPGLDVFEAEGSAALVVRDGVVRSFAPGPTGESGLLLSLNMAVFMGPRRFQMHEMLFYRWIEWHEVAEGRAIQAMLDRGEAARGRIAAALVAREFSGQPPGNA